MGLDARLRGHDGGGYSTVTSFPRKRESRLWVTAVISVERRVITAAWLRMTDLATHHRLYPRWTTAANVDTFALDGYNESDLVQTFS